MERQELFLFEAKISLMLNPEYVLINYEEESWKSNYLQNLFV
jgi:hypothetical protein